MTVLQTGGVEVLLGTLKALLPRTRELVSDNRTIVLEVEDKGRLELTGGMSDEDFDETRVKLIDFMTADRGDAPA